ncbi:MAG: hypothetical protein VKN33_04415 [Candidatus Sericytochromatia bacterium]|nr:hypothetical protein [Candidatus Sericytochromatia bacterium]
MPAIALPLKTAVSKLLKPVAFLKRAQQAARMSGDRLALKAKVVRGPQILGEVQRQQLNRGVEGLTRFEAQKARAMSAKGLYADESLFQRAQAELQRWIFGGKDQLPLRDAFNNFRRGTIQTPTDRTFRALLDTRAARWKRLSQRHGVAMPTHFQLHRGVNSNRAAEEVARVWSQGKKRGLGLKHHSVNSWSLDQRVAERFANGSEAAVLYRANVPFKRTLADKWVDGGAFLQWAPDQDEVIVMGARMVVPARDVRVIFGGKTYGYENREAFLKAWRAVHPQAS